MAMFFFNDRYIHIMMVFWSFLAGVVTFYCSLGPESLLPNVLFSIKPKTKVKLYTTSPTIKAFPWLNGGKYEYFSSLTVHAQHITVSPLHVHFLLQLYEQELFPLGHSCAVCGKIKCKRHR